MRRDVGLIDFDRPAAESCLIRDIGAFAVLVDLLARFFLCGAFAAEHRGHELFSSMSSMPARSALDCPHKRTDLRLAVGAAHPHRDFPSPEHRFAQVR